MSGSAESSVLVTTDTLVIEEGKDYLLEPSDRLPYRLLRSLGHGHSGNVEEVEDIRTGAIYARKTIRIYGPRDKIARRRVFDNEIKIIRNLASHHHIIRVFATYVAKREVGLILQPVADEGDLDTFLDRVREDVEESVEATGRRQVEQAKIAILKRAFGCLASGLAFMHGLKVRHKDIKPRNILIHRGSVLYTDFGYSLDSSGSNHSTTFGQPEFLTRRYSAPEVLEYDSRNSRSDMFSLGCVFIEILSVLHTALEVDHGLCFAEDLERIHQQLENSNSNNSTIMGKISEVCITMTRRNPADRLTATQVLPKIPQDNVFFCNHCLLGGSDMSAKEDRRPATVLASSPAGGRMTASHVSDSVHLANPTATPVPVNSFVSAPSVSVYPGMSADERHSTGMGFMGRTPASSSLPLPPENVQWTWSEPHGMYYYATLDQNGQWMYNWSNVGPIAPSPYPLPIPKSNQWSSHNYTGSEPYSTPSFPHSKQPSDPEATTASIPEPAYSRYQSKLSLIPGTREKGRDEVLDSSYRMRLGGEFYEFFRLGKVFSVLHSEDVGANAFVTAEYDIERTVRFGEVVYSKIQHFVVVSVEINIAYACLIRTNADYELLGDANEYAAVYIEGTTPLIFPHENLTKDPIAITPANPMIVMSSASRLHFGKLYQIEMKVKVKDVGDVLPADISRFLSYYEEEMESRY